MEKVGRLRQRLSELGQSFGSNEDAMMDDMAEFVLSPYDEHIAELERQQNNVSLPPSTEETLQQPSCSNVQIKRTPVSYSDQELLDSIDPAYYIEEGFDARDYEMKKLFQRELPLDELEIERMRLKSQLQIVSRRISTMILDRAPSYAAPMAEFDSTSSELSEMIARIRRIRSSLASLKKKTSCALRALAAERERRRLKSLLDMLSTLRQFRDRHGQAHELMEEGKFPAAIRLCQETRQAAISISHFVSITELSAKLQNLLETGKFALDAALAHFVANAGDDFLVANFGTQTTLNARFSEERYEFVIQAYALLGKTEEAATRAASSVLATIENSAREILLSHVELRLGVERAQAADFAQLVKALPTDQVADATLELGAKFAQILAGLHRLVRLHIDRDERMGYVTPSPFTTALDGVIFEAARLVVSKLNAPLCAHDLSRLRLDAVLDLIEAVVRFRRFSRRHCGYAAGELALALHSQAVGYFERFQAERMDELRLFLEAEPFAACPVSTRFTLDNLPEFAQLSVETAAAAESPRKRKTKNLEPTENDGDDDDDDQIQQENVGLSEADASELGDRLPHQLLASLHDFENPFIKAAPSQLSPAPVADVEESNRKPSTQSDSQSPGAGVICCNTALAVLRTAGKYLRLAALLGDVVSGPAIKAVFQLFHYFLISLVSFFGHTSEEDQDQNESGEPVYAKLALTDRLASVLSELANDMTFPLPAQSAVSSRFTDKNQLFGAAERFVAIQSIEFLAYHFESLRCRLPMEASTSVTTKPFFGRVIPAARDDARLLLIGSLAARLVDWRRVARRIASTDFAIQQLEQHASEYVDFLTEETRHFARRLVDAFHGVVAAELSDRLWDAYLRCLCAAIVQGYSTGGRCCTQEGRARMQLDWATLSSKIVSLCPLGGPPLPHSALVDNFVKAYYLPETELARWLELHTEYTPAQRLDLLQSTVHVSKKTRQRLQQLLASSSSSGDDPILLSSSSGIDLLNSSASGVG